MIFWSMLIAVMAITAAWLYERQRWQQQQLLSTFVPRLAHRTIQPSPVPSQPVMRRPTFCRGPVYGARCGDGASRKQRRGKVAAERPVASERDLMLPPAPELTSSELLPAHELPPVLSALPGERHTPANDLGPANHAHSVELPTVPGWLRRPAEPPPVPKRAERACPPISTARPRKPRAAAEPLTLPGKLVSAEEYAAAPPPPLRAAAPPVVAAPSAVAALPVAATPKLRVAPPPPRITPFPPLCASVASLGHAREDELLDTLEDPQVLFNRTTHRDLAPQVGATPVSALDDEDDLRETLRQPRPVVRISA